MPRYPEYQIHSLDTHGYGRIIQTIDGKFYDGWGNTVTFTLFGKEVSINVEGAGTDSTDGGNVNITNNTTNTNNTDLFQDLQNQINELTTTIKNQQTTIDNQKTTIDNQNTVPTGTIIMWGGSSNFIPPGWKLCDGSILYDVNAKLRQQLKDQGNPFGEWQGSPLLPDLRERFVVGAGGDNTTVSGNAYNVGDKGGIINNMLTLKNIPEHEHQFNLKYGPSTTSRKFDTPTIGSGANGIDSVSDGGGQWTTTAFNLGNQGGIWSAGPSPKKDGPGFTSKNINNLSGYYPNDPTPIENRPPYFALCYIIKL